MCAWSGNILTGLLRGEGGGEGAVCEGGGGGGRQSCENIVLFNRDDMGPSIGDNTPHLHAVPAGALAHDIAIEAVQNALVSQLQGVVQHDHVSRLLHLDHVPRFLHVCIQPVKAWITIRSICVCACCSKRYGLGRQGECRAHMQFPVSTHQQCYAHQLEKYTPSTVYTHMWLGQKACLSVLKNADNSSAK